MLYQIYASSAALLHSYSIILILFAKIQDSWNITVHHRCSYLTVNSLTLNFVNFWLQVFIFSRVFSTSYRLQCFYLYSCALSLFVGIGFWLAKLYAEKVMNIQLGRKLHPIVNFYLHGGTCILIIILNFLRPPPQRVQNLKTSYLFDFLVALGVFTIYSIIAAFHYIRFKNHVYPFLRKFKDPGYLILLILGCVLFYFVLIIMSKNLIFIF